MTINIDLPHQLEAMVHQKVASGRYASASEVVREALQLLEKEERLRETKPGQLRKNIDDYPSRGVPIDWDAEHIKRAVTRHGNAKRQD